MALSKKNIPILVKGGLDTKTNPKLVQAPALLELENFYELRGGELRPRNGVAPLTVQVGRRIGPTIAACQVFQTANGGLGALTRAAESVNRNSVLRYGASGLQGWRDDGGQNVGISMPYPNTKALVAGVQSMMEVSSDLYDPDIANNAGFQAIGWTYSAGGGVTMTYKITEISTGRVAQYPLSGTNGYQAVKCCSVGAFLCVFTLTATNDISVGAFNTVTESSVNRVMAAGLVHAAQRYYDIMPIQGTNTVAVAYRAAAGGVSFILYDASSNTVTVGPINVPAIDATMCLGWLEDKNFFTGANVTGSVWLGTAGATNGVQVRSFDKSTLVASGSINTLDAAATANVRNITGHIDTGGNDYTALWDVTNANPAMDKIQRGKWTGAAVVSTILGGFSLYSRSFYLEDGKRNVVATCTSPVQPCLAVSGMDPIQTPNVLAPNVRCYIMQGDGPGRRQLQANLSSVADLSSIGVPGGIGTGKAIQVALARKRSVVTPGSPGIQLRSINVVTLSPIIPGARNPRELGGTVFIPGGQLMRDDGQTTELATFPLYLEAPTCVSSATGSMTASGVYSYRLIRRRSDAVGRVSRSAGSVPVSITLGVGDGRVTLTIVDPQPVSSATQDDVFEVYRAGPAAAGATSYNKVGETFQSSVAGWAPTVTFIDTMSDANAILGELAYFTGNTLENFHPPSSSLLEVASGRVWLVNAELPSELWYSKEYKPGFGIGFNPSLTLRLDGDGRGAITALASMDGRIVAFKDAAIWVIGGDGPNDLGQGSFGAPQCVSRNVGTTVPASVVETPAGIMFQSAKGIYLLDRGMGLSYVGAPVEQYTLGGSPYVPIVGNVNSIVGASIIEQTNQVRFVFWGGRALVYDFDLQRWATFLLPVTNAIVSCVSTPQFGWGYFDASGDFYKETEGAIVDTFAGSPLTITPRISFPHLIFAGVGGYQRFYSLAITFDAIGAHTISVDAEFDYSGAVTGAPKTKVIAAPGTGLVVEYLPPEGKSKGTAVRPVITISGAALSGSIRLTGAMAVVGVKRGDRAAETNRLT